MLRALAVLKSSVYPASPIERQFGWSSAIEAGWRLGMAQLLGHPAEMSPRFDDPNDRKFNQPSLSGWCSAAPL